MRRIGVYGGTFDPIHIGHLAIAEEVRYALALEQVIFVPALRQPLKDDAQGATPAQRLEMVRLACASNPAFIVSDHDFRRPPPSYTFDLLAALQAELDPDVDLFFIIGADAVRDLPRWYRAAEILDLVRLAVVNRPGHRLDVAALEPYLPTIRSRCTLVEGPCLDVSSSDLRIRLATGRPTRYQIPDVVLAYIAQHTLYRTV